MDSTLNLLIFAALGYLLGSVPFAVIVSRAFRLADPRSFGSGNPGATNVLRSGSKKAAVLTLFGDAAKGWLAMFLAGKVGAGDTAIAVAGLAAFLGHVFPFTLGFKGGKGVATAAGALLALNPWLGLATLLTWVIIAAFFRFSSLASIVAALFAPFYQLLIWGVSPALLAVCAMSLLLLWRHQPNMRKLFAGTESRLGAKPELSRGPTPKHPANHHPGHAHSHGHGHSHKKGHK